jgi:RNA-directed DNA polymerase
MALDPVIEQESDIHSYGSRKYRETWDAMTRLRGNLDKRNSPRWVWDVDISDCFGQISHEFLENKLKTVLFSQGQKLVSKWLKAGVFEKEKITLPSKGVPQGGVISPLLCNIALNGLENVIRKKKPKSKKTYKSKTALYPKELAHTWVVRYVDDFIITCPCKDKLLNRNHTFS